MGLLGHTCNSFVQLEILSALILAAPNFTHKGSGLHKSPFKSSFESVTFVYVVVATADLWFHEVHTLQHDLSIIIM